ncbi:hypothetical protein PG985_010526 [Apiospora marii]|uniref:F-box domain-containing protein n=1 Tax=Apiospora marii TaxID=335849 RepID=A0ABR1T3L1_9PEZI
MPGNRARSFLDRLPTEVLYLILGQFCGHCRGANIGCLHDIYPHRLSRGEDIFQDDRRRVGDRQYVTQRWCESHDVAAYRYREDKKSLASLGLVSKALRIPAQSVLHHFYLNGCKYQNSNNSVQFPAFLRFIVSIMDNPQLTRSVKSLSLGNHDQRGFRMGYTQLGMPEASSFRSFLTSGGKPVPRKITRLDVLERLITALPGLTHLGIGEFHVDYVDRDPSFFEQIEELPLTSIDVWIDPMNPTGGWYGRPHSLLKLLARAIELSRGLRTLRIDGSCISTGIFRFTRPRLSLFRLRCLHLTSACLDVGELQVILGTCSALQNFMYMDGHDPDEYRSDRVPKARLDPAGVIRALEPCRSTLHSLAIKLWRPRDGMKDRTQVSFSGFSALQDMAIQWRTFYPNCEQDDVPADEEKGDASQLLVQALPENIHGLWVIDSQFAKRPGRLESALEGLAAAKALGRFPHLRHLGCEVDAMMRRHGRRDATSAPGGRPAVFDAQNSIRDTLAASGVVVDYGLEWDIPLAPPVAYVDAEDMGCMLGDHSNIGCAPMPLPGEEEDDDL